LPKTFEELKAKGVEFVSEPKDQFYGVEAVFKGPFGNWFSLTQPKNYRDRGVGVDASPALFFLAAAPDDSIAAFLASFVRSRASEREKIRRVKAPRYVRDGATPFNAISN